ncbi:lipopolysaccharide kinase InaA family protein [Gammaproteobacteria bacterium AB-CW1]|uniref:Lipopolysaccharide kinase InaA family protein n=1 Tax=Natronospira elongata TaxID=3110268 RepID=A0AAP6JFD6_9GAMM|nr:lipopolysaccharide kinase InaA family protein [Gammaproteobacteria bacterium AB-CW1]
MRRKLLIEKQWQDLEGLDSLLRELPDIPESRITHRLKDKAMSLVARLRLGDQEMVAKRYRCATPMKRWTRAVRRSKAWRSWWACGRLAELGIPAMERVICFEHRVGPLQFDPVFIGTWVSGPNMIEHLTAEHMNEARVLADAREIIARVGRIHAAGLAHGDLNWTNIRFSERGPTFVDLDDTRAYRPGPRRDYRMTRDWRVLIYNWRDRPEMAELFRELVREHLGDAAYERVMARPFRS